MAIPYDQSPRWNEYVTGGLLKEKEADTLKRIGKNDQLSFEVAEVCATVLKKQVSQEVTKFIVSFINSLSSTVIQRNHLHAVNELVDSLTLIFNRFENNIFQLEALRAIAKLVCDYNTRIDIFFKFCLVALDIRNPDVCIETSKILSVALESRFLRLPFAKNSAFLDSFCKLLLTSQPQLHYNAMLCLWLLSFDSLAVKALLMRGNIITLTVGVCRTTAKEKVVRIGVALWRNLLERAKDDVLTILIGAKALDFVSSCLKKTFSDPDLMEDLIFLSAELEKAILKLSSFDEYASEIKSGNLDWTPPHKSDLFWRDNAARFHETELLRYSHGHNYLIAG